MEAVLNLTVTERVQQALFSNFLINLACRVGSISLDNSQAKTLTFGGTEPLQTRDQSFLSPSGSIDEAWQAPKFVILSAKL